jgi:hypothetical protein
MVVAVSNAPTRFGRTSYRIVSHVNSGWIEAVIEPPTRVPPQELVVRLRHPDGKPIRAVYVNGAPHTDFDSANEVVCIRPNAGAIIARVECEG